MPRAEIERDLQAEAEIVGRILEMYPNKYDGFMKIDRLGYRLDGVLTKKHPYGYAEAKMFYEAKDLKQGFMQHPDWFISHSKVQAAMAMTEATRLRCLFFGRFSNGIIASLDFAKFKGTCRFGGRQDNLNGRRIFVHGDEVLAVFPWSDFVILHDPNPPPAEAA